MKEGSEGSSVKKGFCERGEGLTWLILILFEEEEIVDSKGVEC